ncbi:MAG: DUF4105 domain-containing protein [Myxococcales bacterium]|nr:DUF4105 domain-containing protein [Myxococcales bacterium]
MVMLVAALASARVAHAQQKPAPVPTAAPTTDPTAPPAPVPAPTAPPAQAQVADPTAPPAPTAIADPTAAPVPPQPVPSVPVGKPPPVDFPVIELVTMGVGARIWERHGHIALCVRERDPRRNTCYNYGLGDFQHPLSMGWGFFRADDSFWVGRQSPSVLVTIYQAADRDVWAQPLPLTADEKRTLLARLEHDVEDAHKHYSYDHLADNCSTRVRDAIDEATGGKLRAMREPSDGLTYRDLARKGFYGMRVALLITDIAMGRAADRVPSYYDRMFLPDYLREAVTRLWGVEPIAVYRRHGPPPQGDGPSGRVLFLLIVLALTAPAWLARWRGRFQRTGLWFALVPQLVLGLVLWTLAIISPLSYVRWNESCLVLVPLDLLLVVGPMHLRTRYARGRIAMLALVALGLAVGLLRQPIWFIVAWPLVPALVVGLGPRWWLWRGRRTGDSAVAG